MSISISLKPFNTFGLDQSCSLLIEASSREELIKTSLMAYATDKPMLILGGGSNLVLTEDFDGTVIRILTKGIEVTETQDTFLLTIEAGENWHDLVKFCLQNDMPGLENMALIPGTVGAAPIQNIGAYGIEFSQVCDWVDYLDLQTGEIHRLSNQECLFDYRDSIFKGKLRDKSVILAIGLKLAKAWQPNLSYGPLADFAADTVTAAEIFDRVCEVRQRKLPDPQLLGNAGSFFKNPVVSAAEYQRLANEFPGIVGYALEGGAVKLAAGWLIDKAGLKGYRQDGVGVHEHQALVLVNLGAATGQSVCELARHVINSVFAKFGVMLEPEPRVIGRNGEVTI
ncbi:MAG: UDP-N-acetylmuramate dehydrogenase [Shewanella sp.]|nr:UDP-N-acetylmuramate dehydrogenase [Shewanella sp.]MCF1439284.1 UDP-N-acetylmuramate dehydrogenase [Shewanella sp.]MCF1457631.1 UDP-N-acetylmuramate dehydrogenase [Shewanella sp.]